MQRRTSVPGENTEEFSHERLIDDKGQRALREAQNGLRQFDEVIHLIRQGNWQLPITAKLLCDLQKIATEGVWTSAGRLRRIPIYINGTSHTPPPFEQVEFLVADMCGYLNSVRDQPYHAAAYAMWRLNWIHPFCDGNGRTSRAVSYLVLSLGLQMELPGSPTIPDLIVMNRKPYYSALDAADALFAQGEMNVGQMEELLIKLLSEQLSTAS